MEIKITVPKHWEETAKRCGVPEELMEDLFKSYINCVLSFDNEYLGEVDFNVWLESDDGEIWFEEHGLSEEGEE